MIRRPPRSQRTDTRCPYRTLCRSVVVCRGRVLIPLLSEEIWRKMSDRWLDELLYGTGETGGAAPSAAAPPSATAAPAPPRRGSGAGSTSTSRRSEEHTSELQSLMRIAYAVLCLKQKITNTHP